MSRPFIIRERGREKERERKGEREEEGKRGREEGENRCNLILIAERGEQNRTGMEGMTGKRKGIEVVQVLSSLEVKAS